MSLPQSLSRMLVTGALGTTALLGSQAALAQQKVDPAKSEITFVSKQMGVPVEGRFRKFDAQVSFDPKKPEAGKIAFSIDLGSTTVSPDADAELPKAVWFNVPKFPLATFQSGAIKAAGPGKFEVAGKLAIKGSSRDVVVPVTLTQAGAVTTANGSFAIKRLDFKIGEGDWADTSMVANDVQVKFKLTLSGVGPL
mgnify:FL=1